MAIRAATLLNRERHGNLRHPRPAAKAGTAKRVESQMTGTSFQRYKINTRVIDDLRKRSNIGFIFYLTVPYCVFFTDGYFQRQPVFSLLSLAIFSAICLLRLFHQLRSRGRQREATGVGDYRIFFFGVMVTAITWGGIAAVALTQDNEPAVQLMMAICTAGFCSGGVIAFIPDRTLSVLYNLLMLVPVVIFLLARGTYVSLGVAIALYSMYLVLITLRGNHEYWTALENESLLEEKTLQLQQQSRTDPLTGLFNRRHFEELFQLALGICVRQNTSITLMMIDIDHFKSINDSWGHLAGDEYLKLVGTALLKVFRRDTDIIGRFGGEEFVIVLVDKEPENAVTLAESFRQAVADSVLEFKDGKIRSTVSIGLTSCLPGSGVSLAEILEDADQALYAAKNGGRNRLVISTGIGLD